MLVSEAINNGLINKNTANVIPTHCFYCGSELDLSSNKKHLKCTNPICPKLLSKKIEKLLSGLGTKGFGPAVCYDLVTENNITSVGEVLDLDEDFMPSRYGYDKRMELYFEILSIKEQPIHKIIKAMQLNGISDSAVKIFGNVNDIEEFFEMLDAEGEDLIAECLGISKGERTRQVFMELMENEEEIISTVNRFDIVSVAETTIDIAITGGINNFPSKERFIDYLNSKYSGIVNINMKSSVTRDIKFLISETPSSSNKTKSANRYNIPIVTSEEFMKYLEENFK